MSKSKKLKDIAALVGAVAGIVAGIEKVRNTITKWKEDYKSRKKEEREGEE